MLKRICLVMAGAAAYAALLVLAVAVGLRIASLTAVGTDPTPSDIPVPEAHAGAERTLSARSGSRQDDAREPAPSGQWPEGKAVKNFDHTRGSRFSTWWVRQVITWGIADKSRTIRIPAGMVTTINKVIRAVSVRVFGSSRTLQWPPRITDPGTGRFVLFPILRP